MHTVVLSSRIFGATLIRIIAAKGSLMDWYTPTQREADHPGMFPDTTNDSVAPTDSTATDNLPSPVDTGSGPSSWLTSLCLTLPFLLLFWVDLAHHEMWLDELNAWGISAASPTLAALFAKVHYEGHPWLWYFLLWLPARFTQAPVAMKWVEAGIGTAIYLAVGMLSPFNRIQKVLVFLSYFVVFEYTVISRTYGLVLLFAFLYAWRRSAKPQGALGNLVLLGALANTDLTGIMLSGALLLEYVAFLWKRWPEIDTRRTAAGIFCYLAMLGLSIHTLMLAPDMSWTTTGHLFSKAGSFAHFAHSLADVVVSAWWPLANGYPHQFWNTDADFQRGIVYFIPFVLAGMYWIFRKRHNLLLLVGSCMFLALCFAHLVYIGYVRHWGIVVVAFLVALWILCSEGRGRQNLSRVAYIFLAVSALKGVAAVAASWTHPFSETGNVAAWLHANHYDHEPLVGASDYNLAGVAEQMERPAYFLNCNCIDTYMKFSHRRDGMTRDEGPDRIARAYDVLRAPRIVLVMDDELNADDLVKLANHHLRMRKLADFSGSEDHLSFHLYEAERLYPSQ